MKNVNLLENLFAPRSIAIVGATEKEGKVGNAIAKNILNLGYAGEVHLVNPNYTDLFGRVCFPDLNSIPGNVDLAIIIVPAKFVLELVEKSAEKVKNYVIISAGFSEIKKDGLRREADLVIMSKKYGLNILGPNCLGYLIPELKLNASFAGGMPNVGNIALVSQSGALAVAFMDIARRDQIGFSKIISIGNKMQLDETALLEYLANDKKTRVIGMYLEGIKNGPAFLETATRVAQDKAVVLLKAGKTEQSQKAISSHTGALAGSDEIISAVCEKTGIMRAENLEEFLDLLKIFSCYDKMSGNKVIAVTNAGGPGVLATDAFKNRTITLSEMSAKTKIELRNFLPEESALTNPIDMLGDADEIRYRQTLISVLQEKPDAILAILTPQDQTPVEKIADEIIGFKVKSKCLITTSFIGGERVEKAILDLSRADVPNFSFPERAIDALEIIYKRSIRKKYPPQTIFEKSSHIISGMISKVKDEERCALYFDEASALMRMGGVSSIESEILTAPELKKIKDFPVVIKVDSDQLLHKTEKKGVRLGIWNRDEFSRAFQEMRKNFPKERLIAQPMVERQMELIVGMKRDGVFGPVIVVGLGGIYTEVFKTVDSFIPPGNIEYVEDWLKESKVGFLFNGTRGQTYPASKVAMIIRNLANLSLAEKEIVSLDINPLLIYNDGREPLAVDVKVMI
jgi:acetate---CoA ligase (ADP-forming)